MDDYKPNSNRFKEEQKAQVPTEKKKVEKVISGTAKTRKKSGIDKVRDVFISDDAQNIKSYVMMDVLVPAIKKAISDIVTDGISMLLYGDTNRGRRSSSNYVSYDRISSRNCRDDRRDNYRTRSGYDFDDASGIYRQCRQQAQGAYRRQRPHRVAQPDGADQSCHGRREHRQVGHRLLGDALQVRQIVHTAVGGV